MSHDPRLLPYSTKIMLGLATVIPMGGRAFDYWHTPQHAESIAYANVLGFHFWALMYSIGAGLILVGLGLRRGFRFWPLMAAHLFSAGVYGGWIALTVQGASTDTVRALTSPIAGLILNWALATNAAREWEIYRQERHL